MLSVQIIQSEFKKLLRGIVWNELFSPICASYSLEQLEGNGSYTWNYIFVPEQWIAVYMRS